MNTLPVELLSSIFVKLLPAHLSDPRYDVKDPATVHAAICRVCQKWNQVAKSTPRLWNFIKISYRAQSHDAMRRRLELSGELPLDVSMRLCQEFDEESLTVMHTLLVERVSRWNTLRVEATVEVPSEIRKWVPFELPNVVGLSLALEVLEEVLDDDDTDSREPFISAPHLTFCSSNSPVGPMSATHRRSTMLMGFEQVLFSLTHCPLLREYHAIGIGLDGIAEPPRAIIWKRLATTLWKECPQLEVLQASEEGSVWPWENIASQDASWPALSSLTTLRFAVRAGYGVIRRILTDITAPNLRVVEFRGAPVDNGMEGTAIPEIQFPTGNHGRAIFSGMNMSDLVTLLMRISNSYELKVEVDLASVIDGNPRAWRPGAEDLGLSSEALADLRSDWEWVQRNIPKTSWMVPSGEGSLKRLGGANLSFDEAIAYLDNRMALSLAYREYNKESGLVTQR